MGAGIAVGVASGSQAGRRQAGRNVATWLKPHGIGLTAPDGDAVDARALLAVVAGGPGNRG